ncbi:tetratricopeptide repeat protein [Microbulbifer rhizosphaerae]|uniref:Tetratricopeptide repeat-containing protein n=1 Tax=Microbulbifer rhizosphaerae TaxID=1562603 RepID=A0A7W4W9K4_9GAMM|nr:tetratricopeptide repeat-containing glycosyltransferase family protein [Microbulbifer rhizosphaerae]MBB3060166.1 hypothetical protein [Microbulbifer rhizosphaerae]
MMKLQGIQKQKAKALSQHKSGAYKEAIALYREILANCPDDVDTLSNLGSAYRSIKRPEVAVLLYRRALELKETRGYRFNLANALKDLHRYPEAIETYQQLLLEEPGNYHYQYNLAVALRDSGDHRSALDVLSVMERRYPSDHSIRWEVAQNFLRLGDYRNGWRYFESRWKLGKISLPEMNVPVWRGEPLDGKHLLVVAEQGYGDTLLMARYIPRLVASSCRVTLLCKPELHSLFSDSQISCVENHLEVPVVDYLVPIMSLPGLLDPDNQCTPEPFPFSVDGERAGYFERILRPSSERPNVGIVWSGSITFQNNHNRSMRFSRVLKLLSPLDIKLYSFQKGQPQGELRSADIGHAIVDVGDLCNDFSDTAAALQSMDFIVMTDSSIAHLAASLGKPVVNLLDSASYWLYGAEGLSTPWYSSMHLVRQRVPGSWDSLEEEFYEVIKNLTDSIGNRSGYLQARSTALH